MENVFRKDTNYEKEIEESRKLIKREGRKYFGQIYNTKTYEFWCGGNDNPDELKEIMKFFINEIGDEFTVFINIENLQGNI